MSRPQAKASPELKIRSAIRTMLQARGWHVEIMHGNKYQHGIPDLWIWHAEWDFRWVDCKTPKKNSLTKRQCQKWPVWEKKGIGVWIMVAATQDEYDKLMGPPNFRDFWRPSYDKYLLSEAELDKILDEIEL